MTGRGASDEPGTEGPGRIEVETADEDDSRLRSGEPDDAAGDSRLTRHTTHPYLAPDGSHLGCVVVERTGYPRAVQRPLGPGGVGAGPERDVVLPVDGPVRHIAYSPDGRWLAVEVAPAGGEREQIWLVTTDPEDSGAYPIDLPTDATVDIVCWDGPRLAVSAFDAEGVAEGRLVDPETGEYTVVDRRMGGQLVHARGGAALFRVGARGQRELLRIVPDGRWWPLLPVDTGSTTDFGHILDPGGDGRPMRMLVRSDHSSDRMRLLEVRADELGTQARALAARADADLDVFRVSLDCTVAVLLWNVDGRSELELLDLTSSPPRVIDRPQMPAVVAESPTLTADGSLMAVTVSGVEFPPRVVLYDVRRRRWTGEESEEEPAVAEEPWSLPIGHSGPLLEQVRDSGPGLTVLADDGEPTVTPELVRFRARDGLKLAGWLYRADVEGPAPTVVYLHGGPEGQSRPGYNDVLRRLVREGITVFTPNVRGSYGYGREFVHADDRYGRFAGIDDVEDSLLELVGRGVTDPDRAVVAGRSYGGYLVNASLVRHAGRWAGGVAACGMSDLRTFFRDTEPWIAAAAYPKYGNPLQERELLRELSPLQRFQRVDVPMLFVHGGNDTNVPVSESEQAAAVLRERGVSVDMLLFEDEGHEFVKLPNRQRLGDRMVAFCREVFDVRTQEDH